MEEQKNIELIIKDKTILNLYNKRNELLINLKTAYESRKDFCRISILIFNMERIHFGSLIDKIDDIEELNNDQINKKYSEEVEKKIINKMIELQKPDWTTSENKTLKEYYDKLDELSKSFGKSMKEFCKIQDELYEFKGEQIVAKVVVENDKTEFEKRCGV